VHNADAVGAGRKLDNIVEQNGGLHLDVITPQHFGNIIGKQAVG
jgi:hypothetical protein